MPNDRLSIGCRYCGKRLSVLKYFPSSFSAFDEGITDFLTEHLTTCHPHMGRFDLGPDSGFVIVTEEGESALDDVVARNKSIRAEVENPITPS